MSKDPIGFSGGDVNLYRYAGNNPVNLRDSSGLASKGPPSGSGGDDDGGGDAIVILPDPQSGSSAADLILITECEEGKISAEYCHQKFGFPLPAPTPVPTLVCDPTVQCCM